MGLVVFLGRLGSARAEKEEAVDYKVRRPPRQAGGEGGGRAGLPGAFKHCLDFAGRAFKHVGARGSLVASRSEGRGGTRRVRSGWEAPAAADWTHPRRSRLPSPGVFPGACVGPSESLEGGNGCGTVSLRRGLILAAMSGVFELQPQDGGPRVALAPGATVIGRGPLLGVSVAEGSAGPTREPGSQRPSCV